MQIDIITLFPGMFDGFVTSMVKKAVDIGAATLRVSDLREHGLGKRRTVDDTPYGGGGGMILRPDVVYEAVQAARARMAGMLAERDAEQVEIILLTPQGEPYTQAVANALATKPGLVLVCGHYEGVDERIRSLAVTREISIGDYVLTGGEIPAMIIADSVIRLLPGVLGAENGFLSESFQNGLLEYPQYTRPAEFMAHSVPEVLLSGDHAAVDRWREQESVARTRRRRPDLLERIPRKPR